MRLFCGLKEKRGLTQRRKARKEDREFLPRISRILANGEERTKWRESYPSLLLCSHFSPCSRLLFAFFDFAPIRAIRGQKSFLLFLASFAPLREAFFVATGTVSR
jgi:hypothetical protein